MKVISIVNLKGGVGKTITAVNLAYLLATEQEQRVLLIDADHQGNASKFYRADCGAGTLADLLAGRVARYDDLIQPTKYRNLDIIPADMSLIDADVASVRLGATSSHTLIDLRDALIEDDTCDLVIVDCPPAFSAASINAIAASSDIIIPIKLDAFAIDGMAELDRQIAGIRRLHPGVRIAGCLITMYDRSDASKQGEAWLRSHSSIPVFASHIRTTPKVIESTYPGAPIVEWSGRCGAAHDYRLFVRELIEREVI